MEVLEEILKIVSETKHNGIGKKFTGDEARQWLQMQNAGRSSGDKIVHSCTIFFCCLDGEIFDTYRNPNMNNKDHRVGLITRIDHCRTWVP